MSVGASRDEVEQSLGAPSALHGGRASYDNPALLVHYDSDDRVEVVEIPYDGGEGEEVTFDGVQLTFRFMEDVVRDLAARGYSYTPSDIGYDFCAGFAIFSMSSLDAQTIDATASDDDERQVVEGVSVAPYEYFERD